MSDDTQHDDAPAAADPLDRAREVRAGEELELERLEPYLREHIEELVEGLHIKQFPSGHSNLTYLLEDADGLGLVLRRPPFGAQVKSGHDMAREFRVLDALDGVWPRAPRPHLLCEDDSILGAPFYVMERVEGVILRGPDPGGVALDEGTMAALSEAFIDTFVEIHSIDLQAAGLEEFGRPQGYVTRQIEGWTRRWHTSRTDEIDEIDEVAAWLAEHLPPDQPGALIHNDFKYDNLVLDPEDLTQVRAVLDWEMATVGDPLMDLGSALAYWVEPEDSMILQKLQFGPTTKPGSLTRAELVEAYAARSGADLGDMLFYYVYGLLKLAVIAQQIYYRYKHGHTQDERFAGLIFAVQALGQEAQRAIDTGRISAG